MELVPCVHCSRHVGVTETKCPFCRRSISVQRPQFAFAGKLTRAAIFSAAVVACDSKTTKPTPAPVPQAGSATGSGSDDLEKMLDADQRTVDHPAPVDAGALDAESVAAIADAGIDGGMTTVRTPEEIRERKEKVEADTRKVEEKIRKQQLEREKLKVPDERIQHNAKPYGAPPARRRVV